MNVILIYGKITYIIRTCLNLSFDNPNKIIQYTILNQ